MKKHTTRSIRKQKLISNPGKPLQMLTCYDFQTAQLLDETAIDMLLVGDSVGNVVLGYETTVEVNLDEMILFSSAVKRGAPNKFVVADLPFGTYATVEEGLKNGVELFRRSKVEALKLEGAYPWERELIERLTQIGVPVMGHIGLRPQSVHQQGGYFTHGKNQKEAQALKAEALMLEKAGAFSIVLECVESTLAQEITESLGIPTIGIGSGSSTDGQVLVINDLLKMGRHTPPSFCQPIADLYNVKKNLISDYLSSQTGQKQNSEELTKRP
jgi:3-methyl-2-oxobutanoate hydroxymethyltransferase